MSEKVERYEGEIEELKRQIETETNRHGQEIRALESNIADGKQKKETVLGKLKRQNLNYKAFVKSSSAKYEKKKKHFEDVCKQKDVEIESIRNKMSIVLQEHASEVELIHSQHKETEDKLNQKVNSVNSNMDLIEELYRTKIDELQNKVIENESKKAQEVGEIKVKLEKLCQQYDKKITDMKDNQEKNMESNIREAQETILQYENKIKSLEQEVEDKVVKYSNEIDKMNERYTEDTGKLCSELENLKTQIQEKCNEIISLANCIASLEKEKVNDKHQLTLLQEQNANKMSEIARLKAEIVRLKGKQIADSHEAGDLALHQECEALKAKLTTACEELTDAKEQVRFLSIILGKPFLM